MRNSHFTRAPLCNDNGRHRRRPIHTELHQDQLLHPTLKQVLYGNHSSIRRSGKQNLQLPPQQPASSLTLREKSPMTLWLQACSNRCQIPKRNPNTSIFKEAQPGCTCLLFQLSEKLISNSNSFKSLETTFII